MWLSEQWTHVELYVWLIIEITLPKALLQGSVEGEGANEYSLQRVRPWTEVRIHPSIHAHIISGLNILFLAQTPLLHMFYFNTL